MRFRGPLADSYGAAALLVATALMPYLVLTSAISPLQRIITSSVGLSPQSFQTTAAMANAGYAFGTVLAVQLAARFPPRRMLLGYAVLLVTGSVMTALAPTPGVFIAGHVLQGFCTSLMLIAAVPPLVVGWPPERMPITAAIMNLSVFGAVALGPVVGGIQAAADTWRPLFWLVVGCAGIALIMVLLTWEDVPAPRPPDRWDPSLLILGGGGSAAAFFGASELTTHPMLSVIVFVPLLAGAAALVILVTHQAVARRPLIPLRELGSTKPIAGIIAAMAAGAASVPALELIEQAVTNAGPPAHIGSLFWPFFGGAVLAAVLFGLSLRTRLLAPLVFTGLSLLSGGIVITTGITSGPHSLVAWGSALMGLGVGATVAPALFMAGYSVRAIYIQRVLALVELLRAVAAFLAAPIVLHLALTTNGGLSGDGIKTGLWVCFAISSAGLLASVYVFILGRARLQRPDLKVWQQGERPAWYSPPVVDGIRHGGGYREQSKGQLS